VKILLVAATNKEIKPISEELRLLRQVDNTFAKYKYDKTRVDILVTGVGTVPTTYTLGKILAYNNYDIVFNVGIAGSYDHFLEIGYVVNVKEEVFGDVGIEDGNEFYTLCEKELLDGTKYPYTDCRLSNRTPFTVPEIESMVPVRGITVNKGSGNKESIEAHVRKFNPEVETMEGAAFFYVCLLEQVPFYQIRSISNYVEIRNIENWNIPLALENLRESVVQIIKELNSL
jgi:futalosine hydrolase